MNLKRKLYGLGGVVASALILAATANAVVPPGPRPTPPGSVVLPGQPGPDLTVTVLSPRSFRVTNVGDTATGDFSVLVTAGDSGNSACPRTPEAVIRFFHGLDPGAYGQITILYQGHAITDRLIVADFHLQVDESNETNNLAVLPGTPDAPADCPRT